MTAIAKIILQVAKRFWGEPNPRHSNKRNCAGAPTARAASIRQGHLVRPRGEKRRRRPRPAQARGRRRSMAMAARTMGLPNTVTTARAQGRRSSRPTTTPTNTEPAVSGRAPRSEDLPATAAGTPGRSAGQGEGRLDVERQGRAQVPFRLPELIEALALERRVFIVEGEKDVRDAAAPRHHGDLQSGGAGKWRAEFAEHLVGADVVIVPDNDAPGRKHAGAVARSLAGKAARIRVVNCPAWPRRATCPTGSPPAARSRRSTTSSRRHGLDRSTRTPDQTTNDKPLDARADRSRAIRHRADPAARMGRREPLSRGATSVCFAVTAARASRSCCCNSPSRMCSARTGCGRCPKRGRCCSSIARTTRASLCAACSRSLQHYGASYADVARDLHVFSLVDRDDETGQLLATVGRDGIVRPTPLYDALMAKARKVKPICIVIDNVADVFGGNEIDRSQVRQFVAAHAPPRDRRERLRDHVGASELARHREQDRAERLDPMAQFGARARLSARAEREGERRDGGRTATSDVRVLEFMKSNYSRARRADHAEMGQRPLSARADAERAGTAAATATPPTACSSNCSTSTRAKAPTSAATRRRATSHRACSQRPRKRSCAQASASARSPTPCPGWSRRTKFAPSPTARRRTGRSVS